ncbi:hypothetical protein F2Q70_00006167 [Brassica cretica]|uniref:Uncharacterized protein n=1 Tax=Brassica cretica TaxID=69181 RepID=A0A8S9NLK2_BRACR|nr:hypothetical protein F2Q70_00006167 [Brassica cretica]KAF3502687.1 hypothetical protein F2Q69_00044887 [Brassica cretica]
MFPETVETMNLTQRGTASQLKSRKLNTARDPRRSSPEKNSKETKSRRRRKRVEEEVRTNAERNRG